MKFKERISFFGLCEITSKCDRLLIGFKVWYIHNVIQYKLYADLNSKINIEQDYV